MNEVSDTLDPNDLRSVADVGSALEAVGTALVGLIESADRVTAERDWGGLIFIGDGGDGWTCYRASDWPDWIPTLLTSRNLAFELNEAQHFAEMAAEDTGRAIPRQLSPQQRLILFSAISDEPDPSLDRKQLVRTHPIREAVVRCANLLQAIETLENLLRSLPVRSMHALEQTAGMNWRDVVRTIIVATRRWPANPDAEPGERRLHYPKSDFEFCTRVLRSDPSKNWKQTVDLVRTQLEFIRKARLEKYYSETSAVSEKTNAAPYRVDVDSSKIYGDGFTGTVTAEGARMAELLLKMSPEWVSMEAHLFCKPSELRKTLPLQVQNLIETSSGKGYRLKPFK